MADGDSLMGCRVLSPPVASEALQSRRAVALATLIGGASTAAAAEASGVTRRTVERWLHEPQFAAQLNRLRADLYRAAQARVLALTAKALAVLEERLDAGDIRAAALVLKGLGLVNGTPPPVGPTDPRAIVAQNLLASMALADLDDGVADNGMSQDADDPDRPEGGES